MERLEQVVEGNKFCVFQVRMHVGPLPLCRSLPISVSLSPCEEVRVKLSVLLDPEAFKAGANSADETRIHNLVNVVLGGGYEGLKDFKSCLVQTTWAIADSWQ